MFISTSAAAALFLPFCLDRSFHKYSDEIRFYMVGLALCASNDVYMSFCESYQFFRMCSGPITTIISFTGRYIPAESMCALIKYFIYDEVLSCGRNDIKASI